MQIIPVEVLKKVTIFWKPIHLEKFPPYEVKTRTIYGTMAATRD